MSSAINPEAAQPSTTQAFEQSDRNPVVTYFGGTDSNGGQIAAPNVSESRVTAAGPGPSEDVGLPNYNIGDSTDGVEKDEEGEK
jgi:hypothetical protein